MTIVALFYPLHPASIILNAIIVARDEGRHFFFLAKWKQSPSGADKSREEDVRHVVETKRNGKRGSRSVFDRRRGSWNAPRGRGGGGGDARPKEEFRRKTYAFAIPRRISLEGSGVVDRWIMLAQRDGRGDTRRGRFSRFFSRDRWPKARRVHVLCLACSDILRTDCRISSYKLFPPHSFPVFFSPALPLLLRWNRTPIAPESSLPTKTIGHSFFNRILTKFFFTNVGLFNFDRRDREHIRFNYYNRELQTTDEGETLLALTRLVATGRCGNRIKKRRAAPIAPLSRLFSNFCRRVGMIHWAFQQPADFYGFETGIEAFLSLGRGFNNTDRRRYNGIESENANCTVWWIRVYIIGRGIEDIVDEWLSRLGVTLDLSAKDWKILYSFSLS